MSKKVQDNKCILHTETFTITETSILEENATESLIPRIAKASKEKMYYCCMTSSCLPPPVRKHFRGHHQSLSATTSIYSLTKGNINH